MGKSVSIKASRTSFEGISREENDKLQRLNDILQHINESLEKDNEILKKDNEKLQSFNDQLKGINEELKKEIDKLKSCNDNLQSIIDERKLLNDKRMSDNEKAEQRKEVIRQLEEGIVKIRSKKFSRSLKYQLLKFLILLCEKREMTSEEIMHNLSCSRATLARYVKLLYPNWLRVSGWREHSKYTFTKYDLKMPE